MSNLGTGFPGFRAAIDMVADCLGGDHTRGAVACDFAEWVGRAIQARIDPKGYPRTYGSFWTQATEADLDPGDRGRSGFGDRLGSAAVLGPA